MKVRELIELLQKQEQDAEVFMLEQPSWPFEHSIRGITTRRDVLEHEHYTRGDENDADTRPSLRWLASTAKRRPCDSSMETAETPKLFRWNWSPSRHRRLSWQRRWQIRLELRESCCEFANTSANAQVRSPISSRKGSFQNDREAHLSVIRDR